jgi:hypothetical protein
MRLRGSYLLATILLTVPVVGCKKQTYEVETNSPASAGQGEIVLTLDKTGNGRITLAFEHLAPPQRVDGTLNAYVVWGTADGKDPYKLGTLVYNPKKRSGTLDATFADDRLTIIMTLQEDQNVAAPTGVRVLEQVVVAPKK